MCLILIEITPFSLYDSILWFSLSLIITSFQEFYFICFLISMLFTNMCLYNYTFTVKHVLSDPCVICFPVLSDVDFPALLTIFYVFYTWLSDTLSIPTQNISPCACLIKLVSLYMQITLKICLAIPFWKISYYFIWFFFSMLHCTHE